VAGAAWNPGVGERPDPTAAAGAVCSLAVGTPTRTGTWLLLQGLAANPVAGEHGTTSQSFSMKF